jgi:lysophospholipase L1-like esterase
MERKRILCYGDSNTWCYCAKTETRFSDELRWTNQLQKLLGDEYTIMEEGLGGRTSVFEDPLTEGLCGIKALSTVFLSQMPIDLAIVMLGTNDCKERFSANAQNCADGLKRLLVKAMQMDRVWRNGPKLLVVAPIIMEKGLYSTGWIADEMGKGCVEKSEKLPALQKIVADDLGLPFLDCNVYVTPNQYDFMHFDEASNATFAQALGKKVLELL